MLKICIFKLKAHWTCISCLADEYRKSSKIFQSKSKRLPKFLDKKGKKFRYLVSLFLIFCSTNYLFVFLHHSTKYHRKRCSIIDILANNSVMQLLEVTQTSEQMMMAFTLMIIQFKVTQVVVCCMCVHFSESFPNSYNYLFQGSWIHLYRKGM